MNFVYGDGIVNSGKGHLTAITLIKNEERHRVYPAGNLCIRAERR
jgi:hypothetical protein